MKKLNTFDKGCLRKKSCVKLTWINALVNQFIDRTPKHQLALQSWNKAKKPNYRKITKKGKQELKK